MALWKLPLLLLTLGLPDTSFARYYALRVRIDPSTGTIAGYAHLDFARATASPQLLFVSKDLVIDSVRSTPPVHYTRTGDTLMISHVGVELRVDVFYHRRPDTNVVTFAGSRIATYGLP